MQTSHSMADTVVGYTLAFYAIVGQHGSDIMGLLGFLLLSAKLVQEIPKAVAVLRGRNGRKRD